MTYNTLYAEHQEMMKLADPETEGPYWDAQEVFKENLQIALRDDKLMLGLNNRQLMQFLAWCSGHRPHEPHVILTIVSQLANKS